MKLIRQLTIGSKTYPLIEERVTLALNDAGRAQFTIDAGFDSIASWQPVALDIGYSQHGTLSRFFLGYVESVVAVGERRARLFCREMTGALAAALPMELRHPTLVDVLTAVHDKTGLNFSIPDKAYSTTKIPHFKNLGNGWQAMTGAARAFQIPDFVFQQQGGGVVFVGSWSDSRWASRSVSLPASMFMTQLSSRSAEIAALAELRPGAMMNGNRVNRVEFMQNSMIVSW